MNKNCSLNKESTLKPRCGSNTMSQVDFYDVFDSEDETEQEKESNQSMGIELDPELLLYLDKPPLIKVEEDEIQEIVNRYTCTKSNIHIKSEVLEDLYNDPTPGCSHHFVDAQNEGPVILKAETISPSRLCEENIEILTGRKIKHEPDLEIEICPCSSIVSDAVGHPSSSLDVEQILTKRNIKNEPDIDIEMPSCSSITYDAAGKPSISLDDEQVSDSIQIENIVEENNTNLETQAITDTSENILSSNQPVLQSNEIRDDSLSDSVPGNEIEPSIYKEPLQSLSLLYHQINGLHDTRIDLNQERCVEFCAKILKIKSNHSLLISEIEKGNLIKFEQLVIWGRNLKRNVEDLIKEAKPHGCRLDEAQKFVFKMMRSEIKYRQRLADSNETYIFDDINHFKFHCMACDRRDDNLTWLVAHLCRDTAEMIYMCCFCGFLFFNNVCSLIYHVLLDVLEGPKKEYCVECQGFFPSVANHLMDIEGSWKVSCKSCDFISLSRCSLLIHQKYHKMEKHHVCPECGAYFVFFELLEDHLRNICYFYAKKIRHICPICAIIFKDKESLSRHLISIHHQRWIKCIQCHVLLTNRIHYLSHRAQNHPETPCTYHICHTCTLCPGREFKSSAAQHHMKNHAEDVINVMILYVCDCNYYTIHKNNFIEHKAQNCEATPSFGKWDNDHEMKICGSCNDVKFVNLSQPFVCETCELSNGPESRMNSLTKTYECKACKLFLTYRWEAVIEHFFCFHPNISVHKFPNCVKSTYISGSNTNWISRTSKCTNSLLNFNNDETPPNFSLPGNRQTAVLGNPKKMLYKMSKNNTSNNVTHCNVAKTHLSGEKHPINKKIKANNVPFYNSLSHFMASNSASSSNKVRMEIQKKNTVTNMTDIPSLPLRINDVSMSRVKQSAFVGCSVSGEGSHILQANNACVKQDTLSVDIKSKTNSMQCVSSYQAEKNNPNSSVNLLCGSNGVIEEGNTQNQCNVDFTDNTFYSLNKTTKSSDEIASKGNIVYVKKTIDTHHSDKTNNHPKQVLNNISSADLIKTDTAINLKTNKSLECKKCPYKCSEAVELVKHFVDVHYIQNTYQCMECGDCFANLKNKINHLRSTHKIDTKCYLEPDFDRLDTCRSQFRCPVCLRGFLSEQDKNLHMRCHGMAYLKSIRSNSKEM